MIQLNFMSPTKATKHKNTYTECKRHTSSETDTRSNTVKIDMTHEEMTFGNEREQRDSMKNKKTLIMAYESSMLWIIYTNFYSVLGQKY